MYADYEFYKERWSGKMPENAYEFIAIRAQAAIDYRTFNRIDINNLTDNIKMCQCEICDLLYQIDQQTDAREVIPGRGIIKSETVEKYKVEYGSVSISNEYSGRTAGAGLDGLLMNICQRWLVRPINFMYRGVD